MEREDDDLQKQLEQQMMQAEPEGPLGAPPNPLGGANTGVAGGMPRGGVSTQPAGGPEPLAGGPPAGPDPRAGYARTAAQNNYKDIEGAGSMKAGGFMGNLEGFNTGGWGTEERGSNTHKNTFGKIASRYDPKQAGATKALMGDPDFQAYFPDAKLIEHPKGDLIDFGDGNPVDVLRGAMDGGAGEAWQFQTDAGGGGEASAQGMSADSLMGGDPLAGILAQLGQQGGGEGAEQTLIQQLLAQIQQEQP